MWWRRKEGATDKERILELEAEVRHWKRECEDKALKLGMARTNEQLMKDQREIIVNQRIELHRLNKVDQVNKELLRTIEKVKRRSEGWID